MLTLAQQLDSVVKVAEGVTSLAWAPLALAAAATGCGVMTWLFGGRLMKGITTFAFIVGGGVAGYALTPHLAPTVSPWIGLGAGGLVGLILGAMMFRLSMAAALALMLGVAAPTTLAVARDMHTTLIERTAPTRQALLERLTPAAPDPSVWIDSGEVEAEEPDVATRLLAQASEFAGQLGDEAAEQWRGMPIAHKSVLFLAAVGCAALGFGIGLLAPRTAACAVTAGFGAALALSAGSAALHLAKAPIEARLPDRAISWLLIWIGVTAIGAVFQWAPDRKREPKDRDAKRGADQPVRAEAGAKKK